MGKSRNDVQFYMSMTTGERVETHAEAMVLYRAGHNIMCYGWSSALGEIVPRLEWAH